MSDPKGDPKEGESFFRKVARFVAHPTTDWAEINSRQDDPEGDLAKAELRAMVERKRRNDFVRKRELDMLRRIRREGLTPDQLAALGSASASRLDDVDRNSDLNSKIDLGVKAKIDKIEQQMVGENFSPSQMQNARHPGALENSARAAAYAPTLPASFDGPRVSEFAAPEEMDRLDALPPSAAVKMGASMSPPSGGPPSILPDVPTLTVPLLTDEAPGSSFSMPSQAPADVQEVVHDPELDEAVIAFANADYESSERALSALVHPGGPRNLHGETWLVLFDHHRATGSHNKFEALAVEYAQQFASSAPQWFSLPKLVADAVGQVRSPMGQASQVSWASPENITADDVALLKRRSENTPMPWVLDWGNVQDIEIDAALALRELFRLWAGQQVDLRWLAGESFLEVLKERAPVGERDTDPALWMLRLEALRVANRPDQFDEAAIDYCVTYEVSPPSWERAKCRVRIGGHSLSSVGPASTTAQAETSAHFLESGLTDDNLPSNAANLELTGQLTGDISEVLARMTNEVGNAALVNVSCARLIRLDFLAAGDLLNWVLSRRSENRTVSFVDTHRLVALFFGAMGINEHSRIKVRVN